MVPSRRVGPGQALWKVGADATTPAAFCTALLGHVRYTLPENVSAATWRVALRHFAERQLSEEAFRRALEQRAQQNRAANPASADADAGARVAAYLLREWEQYQRARRLQPTGQGRRSGGPTGATWRRSSGRSSGDRAAQVALLQRLGVPVPSRRRAGKRHSRTPPPTTPDASD